MGYDCAFHVDHFLVRGVLRRSLGAAHQAGTGAGTAEASQETCRELAVPVIPVLVAKPLCMFLGKVNKCPDRTLVSMFICGKTAATLERGLVTSILENSPNSSLSGQDTSCLQKATGSIADYLVGSVPLHMGILSTANASVN